MTLDAERSALFARLQKGIELELSTLPPYLTAMWSIKPGTNTDSSVILRSVFMEEMLHLTLAANVLSAVGGRVAFGKENVPTYPLALEFEGKRFEEREVDIHLAPFSPEVVSTFMQIELPAGFAAAKAPRTKAELEVPGFTIGAFYAGISADLVRLAGTYGERAVFTGDPRHQISEQYYWRGGGKPIVVTGLAAAREALEVITEQGEGADGRLSDGDEQLFGQRSEVAHYYRFKQIASGRYYRAEDRIHEEPTGGALSVTYEDVFRAKPDAKHADYTDSPALATLNDRFNTAYSMMLTQLAEGFGGNATAFYTAIMNGMRGLTPLAQTMMQVPVAGDPEGRTGSPTFEWKSPAWTG